ncbi:MAG: hypothetical protein AAF939_15470 [Planctomycetota bacterium]
MKFSIQGLLGITAYVSSMLAAWIWIFESNLWDSTSYLPWLMPPSFHVIPLGLFVAPLLCVVFTIVNVTLVIKSNPRPIIPVLFLSSLPLAFLLEDSGITRYLFLLTLFSTSTLVEPIFRDVDPRWKFIGALSFATTFGFYLLITSALICASC